MRVKEKLQVVQRLHGECVTHCRTRVTVRDVDFTIDEPPERGGTNHGPAPTETLVASLIGCTSVIGHKCAVRHGVRFESMQIAAEATFDRRGVTLQEQVDIPFPRIRLTIRVRTDADADRLERVQQDLRRFCPVSAVLRRAGTEIDEVWHVEPLGE
jgi:putative redox protein